MLAHIRKVLEDYASGTGIPLDQIKREYRKLPESQKFAVIAHLRTLEKKHQEYVANGGQLAPVLYGPDGEELPKSGPDAPVVQLVQP